MALIHDVIDSDVRFLIDPVTRSISNQGSPKLLLIRGDHNSERFSFEIPRTVEGHDMSLCNVVRVHYINTCSKTRSTSVDVYEPNDLSVSQANDKVVHFSWLISKNATVYAGSLAFTIEFQCVVDGVVEYAWHTGINTTISISDGINNAEVIAEDYSDILTTWWQRIYANSTLPIEIHSLESFAALNGETRPGVLYLLEDDPTIEEIREIAEERNYDDDIVKLNTDVSAALSRTTSLRNSVRDLQSVDQNTEAKLAEINATLANLTAVISTMQSEIRTLSDRVLALENGSGNTGGGTEEPDPGGDDSGGGDSGGDDEHTHAYTIVDVIVAATCETQGYTKYKCSCGDTVNRNYVTALGHDYDDGVVTSPTCTERGYTTHTCKNGCGSSYKDTYTDATGHDWSYYEDDSSGETVWSRTCTVCGATETDVEYGDSSDDTCSGGHSWEEYITKDPTCTQAGYVIYKCSVCGEFSDPETTDEATGHDYEETSREDNTCTNGSVTYTCKVCGHSYIEELPASHQYESEITYATCTENGYITYTCSACGHSYTKEDAFIATGHNYIVEDDGNGGTQQRCSVCGDVIPE